MKKWVTIGLCAMMLFMLAACGEAGETTDAQPTQTPDPSVVEEEKLTLVSDYVTALNNLDLTAARALASQDSELDQLASLEITQRAQTMTILQHTKIEVTTQELQEDGSVVLNCRLTSPAKKEVNQAVAVIFVKSEVGDEQQLLEALKQEAASETFTESQRDLQITLVTVEDQWRIQTDQALIDALIHYE